MFSVYLFYGGRLRTNVDGTKQHLFNGLVVWKVGDTPGM